jgi:4-hydroxy-3-polyprenylbenzoate decarboxylase
MGIDATRKWPSEGFTREWPRRVVTTEAAGRLALEVWVRVSGANAAGSPNEAR